MHIFLKMSRKIGHTQENVQKEKEGFSVYFELCYGRKRRPHARFS